MPTIHTDLGTITSVNPYNDRSYREFRFEDSDDRATVTVRVPTNDAGSERLLRGCTISISQGYGHKGVDAARRLAELLKFATAYAEEENVKLAGKADAAKEREEAQRAKQMAERAEREERNAARKEQLLHELIGEQARIRMSGYKRWRVVTIDAFQRGDDSYDVRFLYKNQQRFGFAEHGVAHVRSLEIKVGSRYKSLWDDGQEDLPLWDRKHDRGVEQYDGELA